MTPGEREHPVSDMRWYEDDDEATDGVRALALAMGLGALVFCVVLFWAMGR